MLQVVGEVCAIHAQVQSAAELSLWARVEDISPRDVRDALWRRRTLARTWSIRGTLHLHRSTELPLYTAALGTNRRWWAGAWLKFVGLTTAELDSLLKAIRATLTDRPLTREELTDKLGARVGSHLREQLSSGWGTLLKPAAFQGSLMSGPPRGQNVTFVRPDRWLKGWETVNGDEAMREVFRRYLGAFGPSGHGEFAAWWGIQPAPARKVRLTLDDQLEEVMVEGKRLWARPEDVKDMAKAERNQAVRLLPNFDAYVMGFRPRDQLHDKRFTDRIFRKGAWISPVVVIDGRVVGVWGYERGKRGIEVTVEPFQGLSQAARKGTKEEIDRLGGFLGAPATVSFGRPG
jgi:AcrR family transcriptional regulator